MEFKSKETTEEDIFKDEKLQKIYKKLEGKSKESIIEIYQKEIFLITLKLYVRIVIVFDFLKVNSSFQYLI